MRGQGRQAGPRKGIWEMVERNRESWIRAERSSVLTNDCDFCLPVDRDSLTRPRKTDSYRLREGPGGVAGGVQLSGRVLAEYPQFNR